MSKWRAEIDISFNTEEDLISFINLIEQIKAKAYLYDNAQIDTETRCRYHECFHDEVPPKPCGDYKFIDFKNPLKEDHLTKSDVSISPALIIKDIPNIETDISTVKAIDLGVTLNGG